MAREIKSRDPIRNEVAACSGYYDYFASAVSAVDKVLAGRKWETTHNGIAQYDGRADGSIIVPLFNFEDESEIGEYVNFSWHKMESGRIEVTVYVSL